MQRRLNSVYLLPCWLLVLYGARAEDQPKQLTLHEAEQIALQNNPAIGAAHFTARAASEITAEAKSAYYPTLSGSFTGAGASEGSRIAAGALNNPVIYNRLASGLTLSQTFYDFGRTSNLVASADLHAKAQEENVTTTKARTLVDVDRAYYAVLRAEQVLKVAEQTVAARQLIADQVSTLAQSKLKSNLDVSFANVNLADAKLLLANAQNDVKAAQAQLAAAMGSASLTNYQLADEPLPAPLNEDLPALIRRAMDQRPELRGLRLERGAAEHNIKAERALMFPSVGAVSSLGLVPDHVDALKDRYGAIGMNVNIPIFNGRLFQARKAEAEYRELAVEQNIKDLQNRVARDLRVAYLNVTTAYDRLALTRQLLDNANLALELAQERYNLGLSSIVELSQAQLNLTSAQISNATARYDYQTQRAVLDFETGVLR